jgi:hypothetical protein
VAFGAPTVLGLRKISINQSRNKIVHLLVDMNNHIIKGLVDTKASMLVTIVSVIKELGIMHLVIGFKFYKIALRVVRLAMGKINELPIYDIKEVLCKMDFMVVDTYGYNVMLELYFLIKIKHVVDIEQ